MPNAARPRHSRHDDGDLLEAADDHPEAGAGELANQTGARSPNRGRERLEKWRYPATIGVVATCSLLGWGSHALGLTSANIVMIFLTGVALVATKFGHGPSIAAAILSVLVFDYFFVDPIYSFAPSDTQYFVDLAVMLGIGLVISELTARLQAQLRASQDQEWRTAKLYQMTRQLSRCSGAEQLAQSAGRQLAHFFEHETALFTRAPDGLLELRWGNDTAIARDGHTLEICQWVVEHEQPAGRGRSAFEESPALYVPMVGSQRIVGVLCIRPEAKQDAFDRDQQRLLENCANLIALSLERDQLSVETQQARTRVETEQLRNSLLSSVSHDLRTPLATIAVTAASLLEGSHEHSRQLKQELLQAIVDEANRLSRQVNNLLGMARLNAGEIAIHREWEALEELVGVALQRLRRELSGHSVKVEIPEDFPLLWVAGDLIELVLLNLLENAARYTPSGSQLLITATWSASESEIRVADNGPGLPPGMEARVFDKFFRVAKKVADGQRGIGLGLAICQGIVQAHGGQMRRLANRPSGGADFSFSLPNSTPASSMVMPEAALAGSP